VDLAQRPEQLRGHLPRRRRAGVGKDVHHPSRPRSVVVENGRRAHRWFVDPVATDGPYAYTRNPQYLSMIVGVTGFAALSDSPYVAALAAAHVGWVLLLPRAEEPHLRAEFGEAYDRYAARVPRFVGLRTVRVAVGRTPDD